MNPVEHVPLAARLALWPWPGGPLSLWKLLLLEAGAPITPELLAETQADVHATLAREFPKLWRWVADLDWVQTLGQGDLVAVYCLGSGQVLAHETVGRREEWRDEAGGLYAWCWTLFRGRGGETRVDASGALLDTRGGYTRRVLVRPDLTEKEAHATRRRWWATCGVNAGPRVLVHPVEHQPLPDDFAEQVRRAMEAA